MQGSTIRIVERILDATTHSPSLSPHAIEALKDREERQEGVFSRTANGL